jgi:chromosome partitioning protein
MKLIVLINNKGGVGKTTSAVNLAASLARLNKKCLLVDLDPSASASHHLGFDGKATRQKTLCDFVLSGERNLSDYIHPTSVRNLSILPSEPALSDFYEEIQLDDQGDFFLKQADFPEQFAFVLFDSPPNMGNLALNALAIADYALIPVQTQYLALTGLDLTLKIIDKAQRHLNNRLQILGYFGTHYDRRTNVAKEVFAILKDRFGKQVFTTVISINSKLIEAYHAQQPVMTYAPAARGAKEYEALAREIIKKV